MESAPVGGPPRHRGRRAVALLFAGALIGILVLVIITAVRGPGRIERSAPAAQAPAGTRVRVEVLNATATRGLARRATAVLRDRGFDVVYFGNTAERRDSTLVLDRSGHPDLAASIVAALGVGRVEARPDTSRYLNATILIGADWHAPSKPFYP